MTTLNKLTLTRSKHISECGMIHLVGVLFHLYGSIFMMIVHAGETRMEVISRIQLHSAIQRFDYEKSMFLDRMDNLNHF